MTVCKILFVLKELNHHTSLNQIQLDGASDPLTQVNLPLVSRRRFLTAEIDGRVLWLSPAHEAVWPTCQTTNHSSFRSASRFGPWKCRHNNRLSDVF